MGTATDNRLEYLEEFRRVLADYKLSNESQQILKKVQLVLLASPTSVGRNTILREFVKTNDYRYLVSDTTRKPRINDGLMERNGVEYWFRDEEEVLEDIKAGNFLEAAIIHNQQVSGISMSELRKALERGKIAITDIEIVGVDNIVKAKPDTICIFVLPPDFDEWQRRIRGRGEMPKDEFRRRLESAMKEYKAALTHDYYIFVVNDKLEDAVAQIDRIVKTGKVDEVEQKKLRERAEGLYHQTADLTIKLEKDSS